MRRKLYITAIALLFVNFSSFSQKRTKRINNERMKAYKIAYITEQLDLSGAEAEKFWPIYNEHQEKLSELRKEEKNKIYKLVSSAEQMENLSESEAKDIIEVYSKIKDKAHKINQTYFQRLKKVLSYKKMIKLKKAEREFKRKLFERLRKERGRARRQQ